ncbi:MAG: hypothetical protein K6E99_01845 [Bacilli bacterium]|nr:hypothetical protein [Bacilli bacterium]
MKRIVTFILLLIMPVVVSAGSYNVVDMIVDIDDNKYLVLTPDNIDDSEVLKEKGISASSIQKQFSSNKIFFNAIDLNDSLNTAEYVINVRETSIEGNLDDQDDAFINRHYKGYGEKYTDYKEYGIYKTKKYTYFHFEYKYALYYRDCYITVINGKEYIITYSKLRKELTDDERKEVKKFIDTAKFNTTSKYDVFGNVNVQDILLMLAVFLAAAIFVIFVGKFILPKNNK